ncbi:phage portal protein family protein [Parabacteroides caeci]|uniref:phage portal protein family protein n=1 Tax=Parabacteroides caeci TaxID=2949650 RepID=UPI003FCE06D3
MAKKKKKVAIKGPDSVGTKQRPVHTEILVRPIHRGVNDIGSWRSALRLADLGNRTKLYDLFTDLLIDGYLSDAIDKRIDAVTDADLAFTIDGKQVDEMDALMDTPEFESLLREIMLSRFWGVSLVECLFLDGFGFKSIPRKHIRTKTKEIAIREEDEHGIPYADNDLIIQFGSDDDFGILLRAAPFVIYKRGGFGDWAQFVELFGMPQRIGKYSSMDEQSRRALIQAFEEAGSAPYLVIPKETEATQTTLSNSGNGALYNDFRGACNEEILITVLGQTMTTQDGSSLAQGQVHLAVQEKKHRADRRFVERMLNKYFVPLLEKRGYPAGGGRFKFLDKAQEITVQETVILSDILPIPQSYLYEKYNIPQPEGDEPIARKEQKPQFVLPPDDEEPNDDEPDDPANPDIKNRDSKWYNRLLRFFAPAPQVGATNGKARIRLGDDTMQNRVINRVADSSGKALFDAELFDFFAGEFVRAVNEGHHKKVGLADTGFTYGARDNAFITSMEMNVFHFSAAKTLAELQELNSLLRESGSFEEFHKKALQTTDVFNKRWQQTEYETAVLTAESASNYQRLVGQTKLFPYWEYKTVGDDKVRDEHQELDGLVLPANDPRWDKIFPPNGWKCRCFVVPLMAHEANGVDLEVEQARCDNYFSKKEWKQVEAQHWDVNRGKTAEVFTRNQMYIQQFPEKASKLVGNLYYNDYGLDSFGKKLAEATEEAPLFEGDKEDWYAEHKRIKDYKGREVELTESVFNKHTTKKYTDVRIPLLDCIPDVLAHPDEVWINDYVKPKEFRNMNFIKFYVGKVINVVCEVKNGTVYQVATWFEIEQNPRIKEVSKKSRKIDPRWRYRRGLLVKK